MPKINTITDFTTAVLTALSAAFSDHRIDAVNVTKNNGVHLTGLTIQPKNKKVAPTFYMERILLHSNPDSHLQQSSIRSSATVQLRYPVPMPA